MTIFRKLAAVTLMSVMSAASLYSCSKENSNESGSTGRFTAQFIDAGKADAIVLRSESSTVVIDCGEKGDGKKVVAYLEEQGVTTVDYLIVTHYDRDHVGGAAKVIKSFDVKSVLAPDYEEESEEMTKYRKALNEKGITPTLVTADLSFTLDDTEYTVYAPEKNFYGEDNDNDFSLVTKVVHHDNVFLFTGDAMEQRLDEIMDAGQCTLLKVPYHGRKLDNLGELLEAVKPACAVVCTSAGEFSGKTQTLLDKTGIPVYATCYNGDITAVSNGKTIEMTTEK